MRTILFILISNAILFGQTKQETEDWINNNINSYPVDYGENSFEFFENITIEDGNLVLYNHFKSKNSNYYTGNWFKVSLKDIKSIDYSYDKSPGLDNKWINLKLNFIEGKSLEKKVTFPTNAQEQSVYKKNPEKAVIVMRLNMEYVQSGMKQRMEKALLHIIKLYGGTAIIKREPF